MPSLRRFISTSAAPPVRRLNRAGTHVYQGAEIPFDGSTSLSSKAFLPSDMWAIGYVLLRILSGHNGSQFALEHISDRDNRRALGNASFSEMWSKYLTKNPASEPPVGSWLRNAADLAMGLVSSDTENRLICAQALKRRFFSS